MKLNLPSLPCEALGGRKRLEKSLQILTSFLEKASEQNATNKHESNLDELCTEGSDELCDELSLIQAYCALAPIAPDLFKWLPAALLNQCNSVYANICRCYNIPTQFYCSFVDECPPLLAPVHFKALACSLQQRAEQYKEIALRFCESFFFQEVRHAFDANRSKHKTCCFNANGKQDDKISWTMLPEEALCKEAEAWKTMLSQTPFFVSTFLSRSACFTFADGSAQLFLPYALSVQETEQQIFHECAHLWHGHFLFLVQHSTKGFEKMRLSAKNATQPQKECVALLAELLEACQCNLQSLRERILIEQLQLPSQAGTPCIGSPEAALDPHYQKDSAVRLWYSKIKSEGLPEHQQALTKLHNLLSNKNNTFLNFLLTLE